MVSFFPVFGAHDLIYHALVDKVWVIRGWRLVILIKTALIDTLCLFKRLDRHNIILVDDAAIDLIEELLLQAEIRITARYANRLVDHEGTAFTQQDLFEADRCEVLFVAHVIRADKVQKLTPAQVILVR